MTVGFRVTTYSSKVKQTTDICPAWIKILHFQDLFIFIQSHVNAYLSFTLMDACMNCRLLKTVTGLGKLDMLFTISVGEV